MRGMHAKKTPVHWFACVNKRDRRTHRMVSRHVCTPSGIRRHAAPRDWVCRSAHITHRGSHDRAPDCGVARTGRQNTARASNRSNRSFARLIDDDDQVIVIRHHCISADVDREATSPRDRFRVALGVACSIKYVIRMANGRSKSPSEIPTDLRRRVLSRQSRCFESTIRTFSTLDNFMTYTAEPAWGSTVDVDFSDDIAFDGLATYETTNGNKQSGRNGKRRGAE